MAPCFFYQKSFIHLPALNYALQLLCLAVYAGLQKREAGAPLLANNNCHDVSS